MKNHPESGKPKGQIHAEWKVLASLVIFVALLEGTFRVSETRLSEDIRHLKSLPDAAERIEKKKPGETTLLVIGNSLARQGIDRDLLQDGLNSRTGEGPVRLEFFHPDSSSVTEWSWGLRRYFFNQGAHPDRLLVIAGRTHLLDRRVSPEKLSAYFVGNEDLPAAISETPDDESALRLLLGRGSRLFANRDRVRPLVGYTWVPGFEAAWSRLVAAKDAAPEKGMGEATGTSELKALERLMETSARMKSEMVIVAVPMPEPYELPENIRQLLKERGARFIDLSTVPGIDKAQFPDAYHLDSEGSRRFTEALLGALP